MAKIVYRQMPTPRELSQQIPAQGQNLGFKSPRVRANFWCKSPGVRRGGGGGVVMDEIDTCIMASVPQNIVHTVLYCICGINATSVLS